MTEVDFFWDPVCPWAWLTSRWVHQVAPLRDLHVDWRFISLAILNEERDYDNDFAPGYRRGHMRGLELLRIAAAARQSHGPEVIGPLYTAFGTAIHRERRREEFDQPGGPATLAALAAAGLPASLAEAATDPGWDKLVREDTETALARTGRDRHPHHHLRRAGRALVFRAGHQPGPDGGGGDQTLGRSRRPGPPARFRRDQAQPARAAPARPGELSY
jgi:hypothetical protein